jgi:hypothetical protein
MARKITRTQWGKEHGQCFHCGATQNLQTHEIVRGTHRAKGVKMPEAWLRVCADCHEIVASWTIAEQLALKMICDYEWYDRQAVNLARDRTPDAMTERDVAYEVHVVIEIIEDATRARLTKLHNKLS